MANLKLSYKDVYSKIGEFMGQPSPSAAEIVKHKSIVLRGYRKALVPIDLSSGKTYKWNFLQHTTTLSTQADEDTYKLPIGFSSLVHPFTFITPLSYNPIQKPLSFIYEYKSKHTGSSYPQYFALKTSDYDTITGQVDSEVVFSPTPNGVFDYYYTFNLIPPAPVEDDDFFIGDILFSECILECALAVADLEKNEKVGVHAQAAESLLQSCIGEDKRQGLVPFLGQMADGKYDRYVRSATIYKDGVQVLPEL